MLPEVEVGVSELVALVNQTFEYAYPTITVIGELANVRVSKGKWLYFDLKDEMSTVKFFGTVFMLPGPLEDGMLVRVVASPRLHNLYGFSMNVQRIQPTGEGSIRKAADLLRIKLEAEGLFATERKRSLPYPPRTIALITSGQSAAYADFIKITNARWTGVKITTIDVQVQGEPAVGQIVAAIEQCNELAEPPEVLVLIRGGGSAEDLAAFSSEQVTRAVAASRIPTMVAIGHEVDTSLAELAADQRASTPSNAAELLFPDKQQLLVGAKALRRQLGSLLTQQLADQRRVLEHATDRLHSGWRQRLNEVQRSLALQRQLLEVCNPLQVLNRGYAIIRNEAHLITSVQDLKIPQTITVRLQDGEVQLETQVIKTTSKSDTIQS